MGYHFAAFLAGEIGLTVLNLFISKKEALDIVVLDEKDFHQKNDQILQILTDFPSTKVIYWKELCTEKGLSVLQSMSIDMGILVSWGYKLKEPLLSATKYGYINGHPSFLPHCRGKHPHFWCIQNSVPCGGTLHLIDAELDTGPIVWQKEIPYDWTDTGKSLYEKSWQAVQDLFTENWDSILHLNFPQYQPNGVGEYHFGSELGQITCIELDKEYSARELLNLIRGRTFQPYPAAYFSENGNTYEVRVEITRKEDNLPNLT